MIWYDQVDGAWQIHRGDRLQETMRKVPNVSTLVSTKVPIVARMPQVSYPLPTLSTDLCFMFFVRKRCLEKVPW